MTNIPKNVLTSSAQYFENINYRIVDCGEYKSFTSSRKYVSFQRVKLPENFNVNPLPLRRFLAHNLTAQKSKVSIKDFFSNCDQIRSPFAKEILNGKLHFLCSEFLVSLIPF